jgi:NTE family protein
MLNNTDSEVRRRRTALALSGGIALGAYEAGAYEALHEAGGGLDPDWIAGASTGVMNAAIIAGNPPERRVERLRQFWAEAADAMPFLSFWGVPGHGVLREGYNVASAMQSLMLGRPGIFHPRLVPDAGGRPGLYDLAPLAGRLQALVDFDRLNGGDIRLSVGATDVVSGERVVFDTHRGARLGPEHVLASCALLPIFAPVEVEGRLLGDGGLSCNAPADLVLREPEGGSDLLCFVVDLFARQGHRPRSLAAALNRAVDLMFGSQTWLALEAWRRERELRETAGRLIARLPPESRDGPEAEQLLRGGAAGAVTVLYLAYRASTDEAGVAKAFDFSQATLADRWRAGRAHMRAALRTLETLPPPPHGGDAGRGNFTIHEVQP